MQEVYHMRFVIESGYRLPSSSWKRTSTKDPKPLLLDALPEMPFWKGCARLQMS